MKKFLQICLLLSITTQIFAQQGVAINTDNTNPDVSAILDVKSTTRGVLVPRMTAAEKTAVATPATGLLVYQTDGTAGFYYYNGTAWMPIAGGGSGWGLIGNAGTLSGTNFIGTTDAQAVDFRTNNVIKARLTTKGQLEILNTGRSVFIGESAGANDDLTNNNNVFVGYQAGTANTSGSNNVFVGYQVGTANTSGFANSSIGYRSFTTNISGSYNNVIGYQALLNNTTGNGNSATGYQALYTNTTGTYNSATGYQTLFTNTTGTYNSATGHQALYSNTTGYYNSATGAQALRLNTTGYDNSAMGTDALRSNTTGCYNSATGYQALLNNTTGYENCATGFYTLGNNISGFYNAAFGDFALSSNTTGNHNSAIGYNAFASGAAYSNSTALGANTVISASDQIRLGNAVVTSIGGQVGWTTLSDGRFKTNVTENVAGLDFINQLRPVTYNLDMDAFANFYNTPDSVRSFESEAQKAQVLETGFIAQEVEAAAKSFGYSFSGVDAPKNENDHYGLRYAIFTVPLVKAVQELSKELEESHKQNEKLKVDLGNAVQEMSNQNEKLKAELAEIRTLLNNSANK